MARRSNKNSVRINWADVDKIGRFHEDGDYLLRVAEVTKEPGDKHDYLSWKITSVEGDTEGAVLYNNTSLSPQSLPFLRSFLEALGVEVPDDEQDLDLAEFTDLEFMGAVQMEPYEGKKRPKLVDYWEAKPAKKGKGGKSSKDEDDEDEKPSRSKRGSRKSSAKKDSVTQDDINDMSEDELADLIKEHDLEVDLEDFSTLRKMRAAVIDAAEEAGVISEGGDVEGKDDEDEDDDKPRSRRGKKDEDDEDEKPARRRRSRR